MSGRKRFQPAPGSGSGREPEAGPEPRETASAGSEDVETGESVHGDPGDTFDASMKDLVDSPLPDILLPSPVDQPPLFELTPKSPNPEFVCCKCIRQVLARGMVAYPGQVVWLPPDQAERLEARGDLKLIDV